MTKARDSIEDLKTIDANLAAKAPLASPVFTGNLGVGVTPETGWQSYQAIRLGGVASLWSSTAKAANGHTQFGNNVYRDSSGNDKYIVTDEASKYRQGAGGHHFSVAASGSANAAISFNEAMAINNAGVVTKPLQPAFNVHKSITQNDIPVASDTLITWGTEVYDVGSNFASNTFTAPVTGKYFLKAGIRVDNMDAVHYYNFYILTSNRRYQDIHSYSSLSADPAYWSFSMTVLADMDAGDTATVGIYQATGSTHTDIATDASRSFFHGYLLG